MWSRNPMPVLMLFSPVPSSDSFNSIFVSAVCLETVLARFVVIYGEAFLGEGQSLAYASG